MLKKEKSKVARGVVPKFTGIMDEFRVTRRALTEKKIQDMVKDLLPVEPFQKISITWGAIKIHHRRYNHCQVIQNADGYDTRLVMLLVYRVRGNLGVPPFF